MVCPYSLSVPGGVQAQVMGLSRELRRMGVEVRVLAPCDGPPPATFVTPLGSSLPTSANGSVAPFAPDPSCALRTIRALTDEQFHVIHIHEPYVPGASQTATLLHPAPLIGTFHAAGDSSSYRYLKAPIKAAAKNVLINVAVSKDAAELPHRYIGGEYEIQFNGVELHDYRNAVAYPTDGPTIFFCARHEERKGLDVLLAAFAELPANTRLWVAGTGPDTARLRKEYQHDHRIEWLGRVSDEDKISRLRGADVFCAPSLRGESFGVVLIEAMAANTAIVASGLDGYRNVATDGVDAVLVEPGDVKALAEGLRTLLADPVAAASLVAAGSVRAEDFSMTKLAQMYLGHYRTLVAGEAERQARLQPRSSWRTRLRRMLGA
jgi:phosphatidyl-myo-inositol alpha-mannosyltransferase